MNGINLPVFLDHQDIPQDYYREPDPYSNPPSCNVNLLELSRYAEQNGKPLAELTASEVARFAI